jgi:hypothetical protein
MDSDKFPAKLEHGQLAKVTYNLNPNMAKLWEKLPAGTEVVAVVNTTIGEKFLSNPIKVEDVLNAFKEIKK